ncbi:hypothetical protein CR513_41464, partial [Mucuna pruriens]
MGEKPPLAKFPLLIREFFKTMIETRNSHFSYAIREPIINITNGTWSVLLNKLLGLSPLEEEMRGARLKMTWLEEHLDDVDE